MSSVGLAKNDHTKSLLWSLRVQWSEPQAGRGRQVGGPGRQVGCGRRTGSPHGRGLPGLILSLGTLRPLSSSV
jgi:hypothetical protein